ncbi:hypothetical protein Vretimale_6075 [Volvox reticuliferus]|uniref:FAD dependent oxidoreductase domain-containing protein n=1 Tax=Volvox reticuliferus TaxID=1737510 RepID=A0A8J4LK71_9CHLO|nr:hypothetical protein Vretifemale_20833 [Volvox reticuliferus]GIM01273.1 hypothetical protein Vretimale_6075 [Volvox reticuliferus]
MSPVGVSERGGSGAFAKTPPFLHTSPRIFSITLVHGPLDLDGYHLHLKTQLLSHFNRRRSFGNLSTFALPPVLGHNALAPESESGTGSCFGSWLGGRFQIRGLGGRLRRVSPLTSLEQLSCPEVDLRDGDVDLVVNAAGLGSLELLPDPEVVPIRGQVVRVEAPWVKQAYFYEPYYIIPNRDTVVLGGTGQKGDFNLTVSAEDKRRILDGCCRLLPSLRRARVVADWVGLRPGRTSLRLELQREGVRQGAGSSGSPGGGGRVVPVVHNYGHGGAGLTLAWGCAGDVVRLIVEEGLME